MYESDRGERQGSARQRRKYSAARISLPREVTSRRRAPARKKKASQTVGEGARQAVVSVITTTAHPWRVLGSGVGCRPGGARGVAGVRCVCVCTAAPGTSEEPATSPPASGGRIQIAARLHSSAASLFRNRARGVRAGLKGGEATVRHCHHGRDGTPAICGQRRSAFAPSPGLVRAQRSQGGRVAAGPAAGAAVWGRAGLAVLRAIPGASGGGGRRA